MYEILLEVANKLVSGFQIRYNGYTVEKGEFECEFLKSEINSLAFG